MKIHTECRMRFVLSEGVRALASAQAKSARDLHVPRGRANGSSLRSGNAPIQGAASEQQRKPNPESTVLAVACESSV
jgi:hypothetical protein